MDLFEKINELPQEVQSILKRYENAENYDELNNMVDELESIGYTCEFDLNCIAFNLQKL